ncbi:NAD-dependent epimerase/dehydratase family protein [Robertkochia marina]|uniref:NAD-dependent epimerase/dehydratase family protein n=1 Tax=Robertkochia marina TaxID=1227945 RepID=A0A4V3UYH5_9FLAO|nr:NAD-dependent epimerase/dehydratase family protein [Robertkochia marina]THD69678.1 NAD-dependent epimerase/dehydratase family protein [Robertkochia marina]TRZ46976.1 NAD-dependent epimerase/dehydratase family protein [Robertkochia marina]
MGKKAIILGATGLTGGHVLKLLLDNAAYETVIVFGRTSVGFKHPKLQEHLTDLFTLQEEHAHFHADEVYCCIGTTKAKTPDKETYKKIDYGIPLTAAQLCERNDIENLVVISALGANPESGIFYNRLKGEMEQAVQQAHSGNTFIVQPALISGDREENRTGEWLFKQLFKGLNYLLVGPLKKYRSIHPEQIAKAMICLADSDYTPGVYENDRLIDLATSCNKQ